MSDFSCGNCNHIFKGHHNLFGKVCIHCGFFNHPEAEMTIIRKNRIVNENVKLTILEYLKKKHGDINANSAK